MLIYCQYIRNQGGVRGVVKRVSASLGFRFSDNNQMDSMTDRSGGNSGSPKDAEDNELLASKESKFLGIYRYC